MRVAAWNLISQMKGLQQLRVFVKTLCVLPDSSAARSLKQNLRKVKGLQLFELHVTTDQMPIWKDFLEEGLEARIVANKQTRGTGYIPNMSSLVRAY